MNPVRAVCEDAAAALAYATEMGHEGVRQRLLPLTPEADRVLAAGTGIGARALLVAGVVAIAAVGSAAYAKGYVKL